MNNNGHRPITIVGFRRLASAFADKSIIRVVPTLQPARKLGLEAATHITHFSVEMLKEDADICVLNVDF